MKIVLKNFTFLITSQAVYKALSFITFILLARYLGTKTFGILSYAISFVYLFDFLTDLGISVTMIREVAGEIDRKLETYLNNIVSLKLIFGLIIYCLISLALFSLGERREMSSIVLFLTTALILDSYSNTCKAIFNIFNKMTVTSIVTIFEATLKLFLIIIFIHIFKGNLVTLAQFFLLASFLTLILNIVFVHVKFITFKIRFDSKLWGNLLKISMPVAFLGFFQMANFRIDVIMLSKIVGSVSTGTFAVGSRIIEPLFVIPFTFTTAIFPTISYLSKTSRHSLQKFYKDSIILLILISLPIAIIIYLSADKLILVLLGKEFLKSVAVVKVFSWLLIPFFIRPTLEYFSLAIKRYEIIYIPSLIGTSINIFLNFLLIPNFKYLGSCLATFCAELSIVVMMFIMIRNFFKGSPA